MPKKEQEMVVLSPPRTDGSPAHQISTSDYSGGTRTFDLDPDGSFTTSDQEVIRILTTRHGFTARKADAKAKATVLRKEKEA